MDRAPFSSVGELLDALRSVEGHQGGEVVPTLDHLLQTAGILATAHPDDPELVAAGLVHDLATALDPDCGDHAAAGGELVRPLLGERVARLVAGHAEAKRYLVTTEASYGPALSPTSTRTLALQGGPMTQDEVAAFRRGRAWRATVALRRADDGAKVPGCPVRPAGEWEELLVAVASGSC